MTDLPEIRRPNGKPYRPRKVIACAVSDADDCLDGVVVFGTHDIERAQKLADEYVAWQVDRGHAAAKPGRVWWRDGFEGGRRMWVSDEEKGRAGVWFSEIAERPVPEPDQGGLKDG